MRSQQEALRRDFEVAALYSCKGIIGSKHEDGVRRFLSFDPKMFGVVVKYAGQQEISPGVRDEKCMGCATSIFPAAEGSGSRR
jgi:hypothetical protein